MWMKMTVSYHYMPIRMTNVKKTKHTKFRQGYKSTQPLIYAGGSLRWYKNFGEKFGASFKS